MQQRPRSWQNWAGTQHCEPIAIHRPRSEEEIAAIVGSAAVVDERVEVVGSGHSFTPIALTDGHLIDCATTPPSCA